MNHQKELLWSLWVEARKTNLHSSAPSPKHPWASKRGLSVHVRYSLVWYCEGYLRGISLSLQVFLGVCTRVARVRAFRL